MGSLVAELAEKLSAATNSLDFDEQTMFLNTSANTVGIGTNAPASKLDVRGTMQVGIDDTGHDVAFYGAAAGARFFWDESADVLIIRGATANHATTSAGRIVLSTNQAAVVDGDRIGQLDFQAEGETGTDAVKICASVWAEADDTFAADNNTAELVFATAVSEVAAEKMRLTSSGQLGIGIATPASLLDVRGTVQVGVDGTGHDVKFFGDTASRYMLWDQDQDALHLPDSTSLKFGSDASGDLQLYHNGSHAFIINKTGTLNIATATSGIAVSIGHTTSETTINDNLTVSGTVQVGVNGTGHDCYFYGNTSGSWMLWDTSEDSLHLLDSCMIKIGDSDDMHIYHDGTNSYITNAVGALKIATETSGIAVTIGHTTSETTVADNLTVTGTTTFTGSLDVNNSMQIDGAVIVGLNDVGYNVIFYGATSGRYMKWDQTNDALTLTDNTEFRIGDSNDMTLFHDGTNSYIKNAVGALKIATETSGIAVSIGHTTSETTVADNLTVTGTLTQTGIATFAARVAIGVADATYAAGTADDLVIRTTGGANGGITIATPQGNIFFSDATSGTGQYAGGFQYTHSSNNMAIYTAGVANFNIASTGVVTFTQIPVFSAGITVGSDGTGQDVIFYGDTAGRNLTWDQDQDALHFTDNTSLKIGTDAAGDMKLYHNGSHSFITNKTGTLNIATLTSGIAVTIGHGTSETTIQDNLTVTGTTTLTGVVDFATHVDMVDGGQLRIGNSEDIQIFHDGTHSYIHNKTGTLKIATATSGVPVLIGHTTSETTIADNLNISGNLRAVTQAVVGSVIHADAELFVYSSSATRNAIRINCGSGSYTGTALEVQIARTTSESGYELLKLVSSHDSGACTEFSVRGDGLAYFQNSVGIGTTAPARPFHVYADLSNDTSYFQNIHSSSPYGSQYFFSAAAPDNNSNHFISMSDTGANRCIIWADGDLDNHDNSYGATSDERIKQDISDANSQWDDIKALRVRNFKKKDDVVQYGNEAWTQIGVIAQEVEQVSPYLLNHVKPSKFELEHCGFGEQNEDGEWVVKQDEDGNDMTVKSMKYSVLYMKSVKALQEAMIRIESLETKVTALENA